MNTYPMRHAGTLAALTLALALAASGCSAQAPTAAPTGGTPMVGAYVNSPEQSAAAHAAGDTVYVDSFDHLGITINPKAPLPNPVMQDLAAMHELAAKNAGTAAILGDALKRLAAAGKWGVFIVPAGEVDAAGAPATTQVEVLSVGPGFTGVDPATLRFTDAAAAAAAASVVIASQSVPAAYAVVDFTVAREHPAAK